MSALTFRLTQAAAGDLDLSPLNPTALAAKTFDQIARTRLNYGPSSIAVAKLFDVTGDDSSHVRLLGLTANCHYVGRGMRDGLLQASGNVGVGLGAEMHGGEVKLSGNAGDGAGLGMRGGLIRIGGDAGDRVGGALPGNTRGMNNGTIIVRGNAGDQVGERMRRGLIIVEGNSGAYCGDRMIAGSIIIFGECGAHVGAAMRRGSILLGQKPAPMPSAFNRNGEFELAIMPILIRHLSSLDRTYGKRLKCFNRSVRWCGDMAYGGKGELLIAGNA